MSNQCCSQVRVQQTTQTPLRFTTVDLLSKQQRTDIFVIQIIKKSKLMGWLRIQERLVNQGRSWLTQGRLEQQSPVPSHPH